MKRNRDAKPAAHTTPASDWMGVGGAVPGRRCLPGTARLFLRFDGRFDDRAPFVLVVVEVCGDQFLLVVGHRAVAVAPP